MQDQEKEFSASELEESSDPNLSAEPVEIFPETNGNDISGEESATEATDQPQEETRARRFFRKVIRWTAGLLVVFGLGFLAAIFTIYTTKVDELDQSQSELNNAGATISDLEDQIAALQGQIDGLTNEIASLNQQIENLEAKNLALQETQNSCNLQIALLKARADVVSAQVELFDGNAAQARVLLESTGQTLDTIASLLPDDLKDVVTPLRTRLELAISEIDTDPETAIDDLGILAGDLLEIENALFGD